VSDLVVDSSVVAKWVLPEADSARAHQLIADAASSGSKLIVLDLVFAEVSNAIWKRYRQKLVTEAEVHALLDALLRAPVTVESAWRVLPPGLDIAIRYDRAVYDALFIALTRELKASGVTADEPLYNAVRGDFPEIRLLREMKDPNSTAGEGNATT
jgi:predicted nucleic acid-binding protein